MMCRITPLHSDQQTSARLSLTTAIAASLLAVLSLAASADEKPKAADAVADTDAAVLRVCASTSELPFSSQDKSGFENRIAEVVAEAMGRSVQFIWSTKPGIFAVRDQLNIKLCDVVMGLDTGDDRVLTTRPYYRAPYVFVQRKDSKLNIENWDSPDLQRAEKISYIPGTAGEVMLTKLDLITKHVNYMHSLTNFQDKRNKYTRVPPERMVGEVADGTADLAVVFAPDVARYVKANDKLKMTVISDNNVRVDGEPVPHHFDQSIAVRKDDKDLQAAVDAAVEKAKPKIEAILKEEGIPLLPAPPPRS